MADGDFALQTRRCRPRRDVAKRPEAQFTDVMEVDVQPTPCFSAMPKTVSSGFQLPLDAIRAMRAGAASAFMGMGGSFVSGHPYQRGHRGRAAQLHTDSSGFDQAEP
jgi:hypothetical protein